MKANSSLPLPRLVGHEGIGEIVELGSNVGEHVKKGDIIGIFLKETDQIFNMSIFKRSL